MLPAVGAPLAPAGFATVFKGWNVWDVRAADELDTEVSMIGVSPERRLRIWAEESAQSGPGVAVADPLNPLDLKGGQVEIIANAGGLQPAETVIENKPGANLLVRGPSTVYTVRFFNRGQESAITWPHSFPATQNFLLETVYQPDPSNPLTSGPAPGSLAGGASDVADKVSSVVKVVAIVAGVGVGVALLLAIVNSSRKAAA